MGLSKTIALSHADAPHPGLGSPGAKAWMGLRSVKGNHESMVENSFATINIHKCKSMDAAHFFAA